MELKIITAEKQAIGKAKLPEQFSEPLRPDLIKRAVEALQSSRRQPYGTDPRAGKRYAAKLRRRRRDFKGAYGKGISRVPRKTMMRRGSQFIWTGAFAPMTVGGYRAHPPKAYKVFAQKINDKERRKALRSALAATMARELVIARGHKIPQEYPFIIPSDAEKISKTKEVVQLLKRLGFEQELERTSEKKVRAGRGRLRGRRYKVRTGLLIVASQKCPLIKAARGIQGFDAVVYRELNAELLAPGRHPGRAALFTQAAIQEIAKEALFK